VEEFLDELTNWYIRRSRGRFWKADGAAEDRDKESAYQALYEVLATLARLLAPFTPFVAEILHRQLVRSQDPEAPESVHLASWPTVAGERWDDSLEAGIAAIQRIVRLGHAARNTHGLKTRQPLRAVTLVSADESLPGLVRPYADLLRDELNVRAVHWAADRSLYVRHEVRPVYARTGRRFGKRMPELKAALETGDGDRLAAELESSGRIALELPSGPAELSAEEVEVRLVERPGTATQGDRELLVALDTELTPELLEEGWAREVVHRIQVARKDGGFDYADRIRVRYQAAPDLAAAIAAHRGWIEGETLGTLVEDAQIEDAGGLAPADVEGHRFAFAIDKSSSHSTSGG
nr:DUF5915 domain-containing protein [Acidobacteriota bacterium]